MPCRSEFMESTDREREAVNVGQILRDVFVSLINKGLDVKKYAGVEGEKVFEKFTENQKGWERSNCIGYGDTDSLDLNTRILCRTFGRLEKEFKDIAPFCASVENGITFTGKGKQWWENHKKMDELRRKGMAKLRKKKKQF